MMLQAEVGCFTMFGPFFEGFHETMGKLSLVSFFWSSVNWNSFSKRLCVFCRLQGWSGHLVCLPHTHLISLKARRPHARTHTYTRVRTHACAMGHAGFPYVLITASKHTVPSGGSCFPSNGRAEMGERVD